MGSIIYIQEESSMSFMLPYKFHAVHWRHSTAAAIFSTSGSWRSTSGRRDISRSWEHESLVPGKGCGATNVRTMRLPTQVKYKKKAAERFLEHLSVEWKTTQSKCNKGTASKQTAKCWRQRRRSEGNVFQLTGCPTAHGRGNRSTLQLCLPRLRLSHREIVQMSGIQRQEDRYMQESTI